LANLWAFMEEREMAKPLLTDELWLRIEPLLPAKKPCPKGGRPPVPDRNALTGILFVLRTVARGSICRRRWVADRA
jgi:transposase